MHEGGLVQLLEVSRVLDAERSHSLLASADVTEGA